MRWTIIGLGVAALAGLVGGLAWLTAPVGVAFYSDGRDIQAPLAAPVRDVLWTPARRVADLPLERDDMYEPRLSWDGNTLYLVRGRAGGGADLYVAQRSPDGWGEAEPLAALNTEFDELGPEPTPDDTALYFYSDRPDGFGGYDLWIARRTVDGWAPPRNLGPAVNSPYNEYGAAIAPKQDALYFASNRPRPEVSVEAADAAWPATVREDWQARPYDLFRSALNENGPRAAARVETLNTAEYDEGSPCVSPLGDFLYFTSNRPGGAGGFDVFRARLINNNPQSPEPLGESINTPANELDPALTALGFALYFSSDRETGASRGESEPPPYALYYSESHEVFLDRIDRESAWTLASIWATLWPWLLLLLLAALLAALIYLLAGQLRSRRLSLIAKCLLASLLTHLIVLLLLSFWKVGSALWNADGRTGGTKVVLASSGATDALFSQIRAIATDLPDVAPNAIEAAHQTPDIPTRAAFELVAFEVPAESLEPTRAAIAPDAIEVSRPTSSIDYRPAPADIPQVATQFDIATPTEATPTAQPEADVEIAFHVDAVAPTAARAAASPSLQPRALDATQLSVTAPIEDITPPPSSLMDASVLSASPAPEHSRNAATPPVTAAVELPELAPTDFGAVRMPEDRPRPNLDSVNATAPTNAAEPNQPSVVPLQLAAARPAREWTPITAIKPTDPGLLPAPSIHEPAPTPAKLDLPAPLAAAPHSNAELNPLAPRTPDLAGVTLDLDLPAMESEEEFWRDQPAIIGVATHAVTGAPLAGVRIQLDRVGEDPLIAETDEQGAYSLALGETPDHFALSATLDGFIPRSVNVPAAALRGNRLAQNFNLIPETELVIPLEAEPVVHHLGNDEFTGRINSQFQHESEGDEYRATFDVRPEQLPPNRTRVRIILLAKGVQCPHRLFINGERLATRLEESPRDGSFGMFAAEFDIDLLQPGENTFELHAVRCRGDLDDFEFVNVQIQFAATRAEQQTD